jgi:hypothetical protein
MAVFDPVLPERLRLIVHMWMHAVLLLDRLGTTYEHFHIDLPLN